MSNVVELESPSVDSPRLTESIESERTRRNEPIRSRLTISLTREGLNFGFLTLFVLVGTIIQDVKLLVMLGGVLIGMFILQWRFCKRTLVAVDGLRRLPKQAYAREQMEVAIELENQKRFLSAWGVTTQMQLVQLDDRSQKLRAGIRRVIPIVGPGQKREAIFHLTCNVRGLYEMSPMQISTRYPFALLQSQRRIWKYEKLVVLPAIGKLRANWRSLFSMHPFGSRKKYARGGSHNGEFYGLRDYVSGDSPRIIHWRSSARRNSLVVRQFERQESQQICVVLDLVRDDSSADLTDEQWLDSVDRAVEFVSTLAKQLVGRGHVMISVASTGEKRFVARKIQNPNQVNELLTELAVVQASESGDCHEAASALAADLHADPKLLIVSTRKNVWAKSVRSGRINALEVLMQRVDMRWLNVCENEETPFFQRLDQPDLANSEKTQIPVG